MATIEEILRREQNLAIAGQTPRGTLLAGERTPTGQRREVFVPSPQITPPITGGTPTTPLSQVAGLDIPEETGLDVFLREGRGAADIERKRELDEDEIRRQATERIQAEIDAINQIFAERLSRARRREAGELGTATAIQARRGIAGSPFAGAQRAEIEETAEMRERAIEAEKSLAITSITDEANKLAQEEITRRQEAIDKGADEYLKFLGAEETRKENRLSILAQTIIAKGLTAETLSPQDVAGIEKAGFSLDDVRRKVFELKEEEEALETEIVESGGRKLLVNTQTGETIKDLGEATGEEKRQVVEAGGRKLLIDTSTGETIKDLGAAKVAGADIQTRFQETERGLEIFKIDKDTGNVIGRNVVGISGVNARKVREAVANFKSADAMLGEIERLANSVITAETTKDIPEQYIKGQVEGIARINPQATVFLSSIDTFSSMLTRAAGEKGVLTTQDVQRIINALPKLTDTKASKDLKIQTLRTLYESIKDGAISAFTEPIPTLEGGVSDLKQRTENAGFDYEEMKSQGFTDEEIEAELNKL